MQKDPATIEALLAEVKPLAGQDSRYAAMVRHAESLITAALDDEFFARPMTEAIARVLQGAELLQHSIPETVDVFLETRTPGQPGAWGSHYGTLSGKIGQGAAATIIRRATVSA